MKYSATNISNNIKRLMQSKGIKGVNALGRFTGLSTGGLGPLLKRPEETNPGADYIDTLASSFGVEPWMLLVKDFPFDRMHGKPMSSMSFGAYSIAHAFEVSSPDLQATIMRMMTSLLRDIDNNEKESRRIGEIASTYQIKKN